MFHKIYQREYRRLSMNFLMTSSSSSQLISAAAIPTTMMQYFVKTLLPLRPSQGTNILLMQYPTTRGSHKIYHREYRWSSVFLDMSSRSTKALGNKQILGTRRAYVTPTTVSTASKMIQSFQLKIH